MLNHTIINIFRRNSIRPIVTLWINKNIRRAIRKRNRCHKKAKSKNNPEQWKHLENII